MSCVNCGVKGHKAEECTKPKAGMGERPCFECHNTGHLARNCPTKKASRAGMQPAAKPVKMIENGVALVDAMVCEGIAVCPPECRPMSTKTFLMGDLIRAAARRQHAATQNNVPEVEAVTKSRFAHGNRFRHISAADFEGEFEEPENVSKPAATVNSAMTADINAENYFPKIGAVNSGIPEQHVCATSTGRFQMQGAETQGLRTLR